MYHVGTGAGCFVSPFLAFIYFLAAKPRQDVTTSIINHPGYFKEPTRFGKFVVWFDTVLATPSLDEAYIISVAHLFISLRVVVVAVSLCGAHSFAKYRNALITCCLSVTSVRFFYPTASSAYPVLVLILHPTRNYYYYYYCCA